MISQRPRLALVSLALSALLLLSACTQPQSQPNAGTLLATATVHVGSSQPAPSATVTPTVAPTNTSVVPTATGTATATAVASATSTAIPTITPSPVPSPARSATISGEAALRHVQHLAVTVGSRPVGSEAESAAADYVAGQLAAMGYSVERQAVPFEQYEDRGSELAITTPRSESIPSLPLRFARAGEVTGDLVIAGLGRPSDFASVAVRGKVALIARGEITLGEKVKNAAEAGAVGAVISNNEPGNFAGTLGGPGSVPAVSISQADGERLRTSLTQGTVTVRVLVRSTTRSGNSQNVIGTRPGKQAGTVILGAHMDSVAAGPGANDNASGVGTALEVARALAASDFPFTVKVIAFGAEEIGLNGSRHYVSTMSAAEKNSLRAMLNFDMVGVGTTLRLVGSERLVDLAQSAADSAGLETSPLTDSRAGGSDHASFLAAGLPALFFTWTPDPNYHTAGDTARQIQPAVLAATGNVALEVLFDLGS